MRALVAVMLLVVGVATAAPEEDLTVTLDAGRGRFKTGEPIPLALTVRLRASADVVLEFATSQRFDFRIERDGGGTLWQWSADRAFAEVMGRVRLSREQPDLRYQITATPTLPPGRWVVRGWLPSRPPSPAATAEIVID